MGVDVKILDYIIGEYVVLRGEKKKKDKWYFVVIVCYFSGGGLIFGLNVYVNGKVNFRDL